MEVKAVVCVVYALVFVLDHYSAIASAGLNVLVEKTLPVNSSAATVPVKYAVNQALHSGEDTIQLVRDKDMRHLWRTEKGELVKLIPMGSSVTETISNEVMPKSAMSVIPSEEPLEKGSSEAFGRPAGELLPVRKTSRRVRTFWPFTSSYYDYYPPPPPPIFGPLVPLPPPGFGVGPPPPPPPFLYGGIGVW